MIISISGKIESGKDTVAKIIQYLTTKTIHSYNYLDFINPDINGLENLENYGSDWKNVKWADTLKDCVCLILNCTRKQLEDRDFKETELGEEWWYYKGRYNSLIAFTNDSNRSDEDLIKLTPRLLLQLLGTQCGRQIIHPNIWVNSLMNKYIISQFEDSTIVEPNLIISDTRFPNEANAVKFKGGINIRINRRNACQIGFEKHLELHDKINNTKEHESETALDNYEFDYVIDNNSTIRELIERVREILLIEKII